MARHILESLGKGERWRAASHPALSLILVLPSLTACGDDDSYHDERLGTLDEAERVELCESLMSMRCDDVPSLEECTLALERYPHRCTGTAADFEACVAECDADGAACETLFVCDPVSGQGASPTLSDLQIQPTVIAVGTHATLYGQVTISDADGDVVEASHYLAESGAVPEWNSAQVVLLGFPSTHVEVLLPSYSLDAATAGDHEFGILVIDSRDNVSNTATANIRVE